MTTRVSIWLMAAGAVASLAAAQLAEAAVYRFEGDRGTSCTVEVGAKASDSLGALSGPPQVGYSSVPVCSYAPRAGAGNTAKQKRACRKAKKRGKKRRGCKRPKHRAAAAVNASALLDQARLVLLGPLGGVTSVGEQTMAAAGMGYSCILSLGAGCSDSGRLLTAIPGVTYVAEFSLQMAPPPGERWTQRPAAVCSQGTVAECTLHAPPVSPQI